MAQRIPRHSSSNNLSQRQVYDAIHASTSGVEQNSKTPFELSKAHRASSVGKMQDLLSIIQPMQTPVQGPIHINRQQAEAGLPA
eukprot:5390269-Karenia_brevis.AAC.1